MSQRVYTNALPTIQAAAVLADPGYEFETWSEKGQGRSPSQHYCTLTPEEIMALRVHKCVARDAWLFLWLPNHHVYLLIPIMTAWGFKFSGLAFCWLKTTKNAVVTRRSVMAASGADTPWNFGLGKTTRKSTELCWLGRRGDPRRLSASVRELIVAPVREHSRKPDEQYARIEEFCPGPYLELFARQRWPNWTAWGNQTELFHVKDDAA
jgi:N6-adenosine-specific RNA methylase IME4